MSSLSHQRLESTKRKLRRDILAAKLPFASKAKIFNLLAEDRVKAARRELRRAQNQEAS